MRREGVERINRDRPISLQDNEMWNINLIRAYYNDYDHTTLNAPVPVRSPKLSSVGPDQYQYLDG